METRKCIKCGYVKSADDFYVGQGNTCKECNRKAARKWRSENPVRYKATRKAWEKDNINLAITRRKNRLKRRYHLSPDRITAILVAQDYKCAVCGVALQDPFSKEPEPDATKPVMDHDHRDGHVRGALCSACNTGLGQFEDDPQIVKGAYYYLKNDIEKRRG